MAFATDMSKRDFLSSLAVELKLEIASHRTVPDIRQTLPKVSQHFSELVTAQESELLRRLSAQNIPKQLRLSQPCICDSYDAIQAHNLVPKILRGIMLRGQDVAARKALYQQWTPTLERKTQILTQGYFRIALYDWKREAVVLRHVRHNTYTRLMYMRLWHRRTGEILIVPAVLVWVLGALTVEKNGPDHPLYFGNPTSYYPTGYCASEPKSEITLTLDNHRERFLLGSYTELRSQEDFDALVNICTDVLVAKERPRDWLMRCIGRAFQSLWIVSHNETVETFTVPNVMADAPYQAIPF